MWALPSWQPRWPQKESNLVSQGRGGREGACDPSGSNSWGIAAPRVPVDGSAGHLGNVGTRGKAQAFPAAMPSHLGGT